MKNSMRNITLGLTAVLAAGFIGTSVHTAHAGNSDNVTINAVVVEALTVTAGQALNFGSVALNGNATSATVDNTGAITAGNADITLFAGTGEQQGQFTVSGEAALAFTISTDATVTLTGPSAGVTVDTFTIDGVAAPSAGLTLTTTGVAETFNLGGTINFAGTENAGAYTGTVAVTADYD